MGEAGWSSRSCHVVTVDTAPHTGGPVSTHVLGAKEDPPSAKDTVLLTLQKAGQRLQTT